MFKCILTATMIKCKSTELVNLIAEREYPNPLIV